MMTQTCVAKTKQIVDIIHVKYWHLAKWYVKQILKWDIKIFVKAEYSFILYQKGRNDNLDLFSELKIKTGKTNRKKKYETEKI